MSDITENTELIQQTPAQFKQNLESVLNLVNQLINSSQYHNNLLNNPDYEPDTTLEDARDTVEHALAVYQP